MQSERQWIKITLFVLVAFINCAILQNTTDCYEPHIMFDLAGINRNLFTYEKASNICDNVYDGFYRFSDNASVVILKNHIENTEFPPDAPPIIVIYVGLIKEENSSSDVWTNGFPLSEDAEKGFPWENNPELLDDCAYLKYTPEAEESVKFQLVAYDCDSDDENAEAFHYLLCAKKAENDSIICNTNATFCFGNCTTTAFGKPGVPTSVKIIIMGISFFSVIFLIPLIILYRKHKRIHKGIHLKIRSPSLATDYKSYFEPTSNYYYAYSTSVALEGARESSAVKV